MLLMMLWKKVMTRFQLLGVLKADPKAEYHNAILVVSEPVTSSKEDMDAFND